MDLKVKKPNHLKAGASFVRKGIVYVYTPEEHRTGHKHSYFVKRQNKVYSLSNAHSKTRPELWM
jgi:ribosomal protein L36